MVFTYKRLEDSNCVFYFILLIILYVNINGEFWVDYYRDNSYYILSALVTNAPQLTVPGGIYMSIYKRKNILKIISIFLCIFLLSLLVACNNRKINEPINTTPITSNDKIEPLNKADENLNENKQPQENVIVNKEDNNKFTEEPKLEDFVMMDEFIKDYTFDLSYDESLDYYQRTYYVNGEYDLNGDGIADKISAVLKAGYEDGSYLEVEGINLILYHENPSGEVYIYDIDSRDNYCNIAIYDDGPSGDPYFSFYQYDGNNLSYIGTIDRYALTDGQGKFISWFHLSSRFTPQFYSAWGEFKDGEYIINHHDISQYIGKTYEFDGMAYFIPMDYFPDNYFEHTVWDPEALKEFDTTQIKLLDIYIDKDYPVLNWFYVEMPDGERGLLYFWIGA